MDEDFTPMQAYANDSPLPSGPKFLGWVQQEVDSFGGGSKYLDYDLFNLAHEILSGAAEKTNIVSFNRVIAWRAEKQREIRGLVQDLVARGLIPESVPRGPVQLLPISKEAFANRTKLIKAAPELLVRFEVPEAPEAVADAYDGLQTKFFAPLYWLGIVLARAREKAPEKCDFRKVVLALLEMGIVHVPEGRGREEHVIKITENVELEGETLFLGMDEVTRKLPKRKPFFGWRLPPYDVCGVPVEEKDDGDVGEWGSAFEESGERVYPSDEDSRKSGSSDVGGIGGIGSRGSVRRDLGLFVLFLVLAIMLSGFNKPLAVWNEVKRVLEMVGYLTMSLGENPTLSSG